MNVDSAGLDPHDASRFHYFFEVLKKLNRTKERLKSLKKKCIYTSRICWFSDKEISAYKFINLEKFIPSKY